MIKPALYLEIIEFLDNQYRSFSPWIYRRVILCLDSGQYLIRRGSDGKLSMYCGWFVVNKEDLPAIVDGTWTANTVGDVIRGNYLWVIDAACTDSEGFTPVKQALRRIYPKSTGVSGIAWLRNDTRLIRSDKQTGA